MKISSFFLMVGTSFLATICSPENEPASYISVQTENIISVQDNQNNFNLNDQIIISTDIPNAQLDAEGNSFLITDLFYNDQINDSFLEYALTLYRQNGFGTLSEVTVTNDDVVTLSGNIQNNNSIISVNSIYDTDTDSFRSSFGIILKEPGTFYLSHPQFETDNLSSIFVTGGLYESGFVEIATCIENSSSNCAYEFEVIE